MYALITDNSFVKWINLQEDYPNTSFPFPLTENDLPPGVVIVEPDSPPPVGIFQISVRNEIPSFIDGKWRLTYTARDMTDSEKELTTNLKAQEIRVERDRRLREEIDTINAVRWESMSEEEKSAVRSKRQALLDIPQQPGFPFSVVWP